MNLEQLQEKVLDLMASLAEAANKLGTSCREFAEASHAYRQAKAKAYLEAVIGEKKTVDHIKALVDKSCEREMWRMRLAEAEKESTMQLIYTRRAELSAAQSLLAKEREEAKAVAYGQAMGA